MAATRDEATSSIEQDILGLPGSGTSRRSCLRFVIVGSVDDGKSTLIGRLLHDTQRRLRGSARRRCSSATTMAGDDDRLLALHRRPGGRARAGHHHRRRLPLLRDRAAQVHHRRHARARAVHAQHGRPARRRPTSASSSSTRASACSQQSRRHAYIASLLGHSAPARRASTRWTCAATRRGRLRARSAPSSAASPASSAFTRRHLHPDERAAAARTSCSARAHMPWYDGPTVLELPRDACRSPRIATSRDFRYPVQYVLRPEPRLPRLRRRRSPRAWSRRATTVMVLPSGKTSRVTRHRHLRRASASEAFAPESVTLRLEDEIDCSRGDMIVHPTIGPRVARTLRRARGLAARARRSIRTRPTSSSTPRAWCACRSTPWPREDRSGDADRACRRRRSGSTTSAGSPSPATSRSTSTPIAAIAPPARSSSSTRSPTTPSARA